jgi:YfiH family protein
VISSKIRKRHCVTTTAPPCRTSFYFAYRASRTIMSNINVIKPAIFNAFPEVVAAESTRHGGFSPMPFQSLNLGINTDDEPKNIDKNRQHFFEQLGLNSQSYAGAHQVHSNKVYHAQAPALAAGYDALITNVSGLSIGVTVADCCPILIFDARQKAIAAVHAGWRGTVAKIVLEALQEMQAIFRTQPENCYAYVGTCISQANYEVDSRVADQFEAACKEKGSQPGKWMVDIRKANHRQLLSAGLPAHQIEVSPYCTWANNEDYFSYRKEKGQTGRMLAVICLEA